MTVLSIRQIYDVARAAGFDEHEAVTWTAIAMAESGGRTTALATKGEHSVGLWQINLAADAGRTKYGDLHDPANNAKAAFDISHHGSDMRPWTTAHTRGDGVPSYRKFLGGIEKEIGVQGDPRGVGGYHAHLPAPMRYDSSYDRIDDGRALAGGSGAVPGTDGSASTAVTTGSDVDTDHDGLTDAFEKLAGTDPNSPDTDHDGLTDAYEATVSHTDPLAADTDHDGISDPDELNAGTDPGHLPGNAGVVGSGPLAENVRNGIVDTDHDGLSDHAEQVLHTDPNAADTDHDGLTDAQEVALGTDPLSVDTDHDGLTDGYEVAHHTNPLDQPVTLPSGASATPADQASAGDASSTGAADQPSPPKEADHSKLDVFMKEARDQVGDRYVYGARTRLSDHNPNTFDCSSFTQWAAHQAGVELPRTAEQQYRFLKHKDRLVSVDEAMHTKGALLFYFSREPTSSLPAGQAHVAISDGKGHTIEAKGTKYGVGEWSAKHRFNFAGVIPGMSDQAPEPKSAPDKDAFAIDQGRAVDQAATDHADVADGLTGSSGSDVDTDHDGLTDAFEKLAGTDPNSPDTDHDGLTDAYEATVSHTDPLAADTDHDGISDPDELNAGTDPGHLPGNAGVVGSGPLAENVRNGIVDTDHDGLSDHAEQVLHTDPNAADTDHDGLTDAQEVALGTDPLSVDTDHDGLTDGYEVAHHTNPLGATPLGSSLGSDVTGGQGSPLGDPGAAQAGAAGIDDGHHGGLADVLDHG